MILNPAIVAMLLGSLVVCVFAVYASHIGLQIIRWWDIGSGSERQLALERKTYLVSTILSCVLGFELFSLFLFVHTADHIHPLFVGAMCAAGSLNVNAYGYPALFLKLLNFMLCGIWLLVNRVDHQGFDYPLVRTKYRFLLFITGSLLVEAFFQGAYLLDMRADVITSCCGTLFSEDARTISGEIAALPSFGTKVVFYLSLILTLRSGIHFYVTGRAASVFSSFSLWFLFLSLVSVISFIGPYFYELPTHHCPFCLFQKEYHYIGYPLYLSLFGAGIAGTNVGFLARLKGAESLKGLLPGFQKGLCLTAMIGYTVFAAISTYPMLFSDFRLEGY